MKERGLFFVLAVFVIFLAWPSASPGLPKTSAKDLSSTGLSPTLLVKSPAVGENWALKSKHDITWTSSHVTGYLRIDLYSDLPSPHKVGTITTNAAVSNGKYTWEAGKYLGGAVTEHGRNYRIVITASNPSLTKSSPQFNLTVPSGQLNPLSPVTSGVKGLSFTYPRRGDGFHKGMPYTITWQSVNLNNARLKLELLDNDEVTLRQTIADNFENKGKMLWTVPMSLPDAEKLYKIRLQTMDGAQKSVVGPIRISKGTALPASLMVTNPIKGDKNFGDTIRVKWTSTATCSGGGGPLDAGFRIELIKLDEQDHTKIIARDILTDQAFVFDQEKPAGYLNWHWDWVIEPGSCQYGTYKIYVTSLTSTAGCGDYSDIFRIYDPKSLKKISLPATVKNHKRCSAEVYETDPREPTCPTYTDPTPRGWVGSRATYTDLGGSIAASEHQSTYTRFYSEFEFPGMDWAHIRNRTVKKAILEMFVDNPTWGGWGFCAEDLIGYKNWKVRVYRPSTPSEPLQIDVTSQVKSWMSSSFPAGGRKGFSVVPWMVHPDDNNQCVSYYDAHLRLEFE